ncbi:hypothetical protein B0H19DRAFT_1275338 [Mycena capillaripes]|nr:hypothetical protein B0H19DRAFT_1275338 [Mycena capillaripes]
MLPDGALKTRPKGTPAVSPITRSALPPSSSPHPAESSPLGPLHRSKSPQDSTSLNEVEAQTTPIQRAGTTSNRQLGEQPTPAALKTPGCPLQSSVPPLNLQSLNSLPRSSVASDARLLQASPLYQDTETIQELNLLERF